MKCNMPETIFVRYLEGEATAEERGIMEAHLNECALCRNAAYDYRIVKETVCVLPRVRTNERTIEAIVANVYRAKTKQRERIIARMLPLGALAATIMAGIFALNVMRIETPSPIASYLLSDATSYEIAAIYDISANADAVYVVK